MNDTIDKSADTPVAGNADAAPAGRLDPALRNRLLADPAAILNDREVMRALVDAREAEVGENVIDIRGRAMAALESRLDRLEAAHEGVISAAYENQSGTHTIHRAVLALLEPMDTAGFAAALETEVAPILRVETLKLVFEAEAGAGAGLPQQVVVVPPGAIALIVAAGRRAPRGDDIVLRRAAAVTEAIHGEPVGSEALLPLDLGPGAPPALLVMGSLDPQRFTAAQGTDLLRFFLQAFRLILMGWLRR